MSASHDLPGELSTPAAELYDRVLAAGELPATGVPAETELIALRLARYGGPGDSLLRVVPRLRAMQVLLERQLDWLAGEQARLGENLRRFAAFAESAPMAAEDAEGGVEGVEVLPTLALAASRAAEMYRSARTSLRATYTADFPNRPTPRRAALPPVEAIGRGAVFRAVYAAEFAGSPQGEDIVRRSAEAGEEVRIRPAVATKMMLVDDEVALVAIRSDGTSALLVRAPEIVTLLAEWFDGLWADPASVPFEGTRAPELTAAQLRILRRLAAGYTDKQIAAEQDVHVRTVRRHVTFVMDALGVETRFAAGAAAVRKGWI